MSGGFKLENCKLTLGAKFILLTIVILSITMSVSAAVDYRMRLNQFTSDLVSKAKTNGHFVSSIAVEALLSHDYITLDKLMRSVSSLDDVVYSVMFSAEDNQPVTSYLNEQDTQIRKARDRISSEAIDELVGYINRDPNVSSIHFPMFIEDELVATLLIGVDDSRLAELAKQELYRQLLTNAVIICVLSLFIYIAFKFNTLRPINSLIAGSERIAQGNLEQDVKVSSNDEIGKLTRSFNYMMHRLKQSLDETTDAMDQLRDLNKTLEERIKKRTARLELAQKIAHMGHWDLDVNDSKLHVSVEFYNIFGIEGGRVVDAMWLMRYVHPDDRRSLYDEFNRAIKKYRDFSTELRIIRKDKIQRTISITAKVTTDPTMNEIYLFGVVQDVTERSMAEDAAKKALMDKLDAESANRAKSIFLANMSHEIRTPLTSIIGFAESLLQDSGSTAEQQEAVKTILKNGNHLLHVINEILDLSKIESRKLDIEIVPTLLHQVVNDVEAIMAMQIREKGLVFAIDYQYPLPKTLYTDPTRLKQILLNLCSNSVKFTMKGSVRLEFGCDVEKHMLLIAVVDTGIGIPESKIETLFEPFSQADTSTTRRFGGTGLGLYISRQMVEMLGGEIAIKSIEGLGTRVDIKLPTGDIPVEDYIHEPADQPERGNVIKSVQLEGQLSGDILLAEDSIDNQKLISMYIKQTGACVDIANNGEEAVNRALVKEYDLVLMDMQMPVMDGVDATRNLRQAGYSGPIVVLTANAMREDKERCKRAGCDYFLTKPVDRNAFFELLSTVLCFEGPPGQRYRSTDSLDNEIEELKAEFVERLDSRMGEIRAHWRDKNWTALKQTAHQLKGAAGGFGFPHISEQAANLESALKQEKFDELSKEYTILLDSMARAVEQVPNEVK